MRAIVRQIAPLTVERLFLRLDWDSTRAQYMTARFGNNPILNGMVAAYNWITKSRIRITKKDALDANVTLAKIILPTLERLKVESEKAISFAIVDDDDVPETMSMEGLVRGSQPHTDMLKRRWHYVLDRMIFAFKLIADEYSYYEDFSLGEVDGVEAYSYGLILYEREAELGTKLFGKYYAALWC